MPKHIHSFSIVQMVDGRPKPCASGWASPTNAKAMLKGLRLTYPLKHFVLEEL